MNSTPFVSQYGIQLTNGVLYYAKGSTEQEVLTAHEHVASWGRIYLEEGLEGLYIERRGRGNKGIMHHIRCVVNRKTAIVPFCDRIPCCRTDLQKIPVPRFRATIRKTAKSSPN